METTTNLNTTEGHASKRRTTKTRLNRKPEVHAASLANNPACEENRCAKFVASASSLRALSKSRAVLDLSALNVGKIEFNWTRLRGSTLCFA